MRIMAIAAAMATAAAPTLAQAQDACLTEAEFTSLATYALPSVIEGTNKRCATVLPADSYLRKSGQQLTDRYAARKDAAWPNAKAAFLKLTAKDGSKSADLIKRLPDSAQRDMLDVVLEGMISQEIGLDTCPTIDNFARLLAPLPPENTAELISLVVSLSTKDKAEAKVGKLTICTNS